MPVGCCDNSARAVVPNFRVCRGAGMSYHMDFEEEGNVREEDAVMEYEGGFRLVCDPKSLLYLFGMEVRPSQQAAWAWASVKIRCRWTHLVQQMLRSARRRHLPAAMPGTVCCEAVAMGHSRDHPALPR